MNVLPAVRGPAPLRQLLAELTHFFALMLWVAAGLAAIAGLGRLAVAICVVVVLNAAFAFTQEFRADRATARLGDLLPAQAQVLRDGRRQVVGAAEPTSGSCARTLDGHGVLTVRSRVLGVLRVNRRISDRADQRVALQFSGRGAR